MKKLGLITAALAIPMVSFAQQLTNLETLVRSIGRIVNLVIPIVFALALLAFFWGLVRYIFAGASDQAAAKNLMIWAVVALFVMASVWGLVNFLQSAFGIQEEAAPSVSPLIPKNGS